MSRNKSPTRAPRSPEDAAAQRDPSTELTSEYAGLSSEDRHALPPFAALCAFEAIGAYGGIRRAAVALARDHAAVSRRLRELEAWAGVPLVERGGGRLTPQGMRFHARTSRLLKELANAGFELTHRGDDGRLRLWCVPGIAVQWLAPRLGAFANAYPDIDLELQPTDATPNFTTHEADAVLRYVIAESMHKIADPDLISVQIAQPTVMAVASPKFISKLRRPIKTPEDLLSAPLLHEASFGQWRRWFSAHGIDVGDRLSGPRLWHAHLTVAAAKRGQGVALSNVFLISEELRSGALVEIATGASVHLGSYIFSARRDRWRDRSIHSFRRWLEQSVAWAVPPKP
jgi:DNA-binding transcriptional LysR family regulator